MHGSEPAGPPRDRPLFVVFNATSGAQPAREAIAELVDRGFDEVSSPAETVEPAGGVDQ